MENKSALKVRVQKLGTTLSNMVMPNIGAFIAWGILAMLFIETGWFPNPTLSVMVSPILTYLLPLLIGYTAGFNAYGQREHGVSRNLTRNSKKKFVLDLKCY